MAFSAQTGRDPGAPGDDRPRRCCRAGRGTEVGHVAASFSLRIIVLPVLDQQIRPAGTFTFIVPERVHASTAYQDWLRKLVRALT